MSLALAATYPGPLRCWRGTPLSKTLGTLPSYISKRSRSGVPEGLLHRSQKSPKFLANASRSSLAPGSVHVSSLSSTLATSSRRWVSANSRLHRLEDDLEDFNQDENVETGEFSFSPGATASSAFSGYGFSGKLWEKEIPLDPGRRALSTEYCENGTVLLDRPLKWGGSLQVTAHPSTEWQAPEGAPKGTTQEWRVLRFKPDTGSNDLLQSVTKVCTPPAKFEGPPLWLRCDALPLDYTKTIVSTVSSALRGLGAPVMETSGDAPPVKILCIGVGGGSVPSFFAQRLPNCQVEAVELEREVVYAAQTYMGLVTSPKLRLFAGDGAEYAMKQAKAGVSYDAIVIDAYNPDGEVPATFWTQNGIFLQALEASLLNPKHGVVVINFLPFIDLGPPLRAFREVFERAGMKGMGFSVQAEGTGNRLLVQMCGEKLPRTNEEARLRLQENGMRLEEELECPFSMRKLAARHLVEW